MTPTSTNNPVFIVNKIAIANRGEVAVRIIRACQELGISTVLLHSDVDTQTKAYRLADETVCIGPASAKESYLNIEANIIAALSKSAQAIHPGFGFLSENAEFAKRVEESGLIFIGPTHQTISQLGDKIKCKDLVKTLNIPLVPGYQGNEQDVDSLTKEAQKIGFPVIVKAAAGGGGRGMKLLKSIESCRELIESAQREAASAFGSPQVFLEKYLDRAKHIEFQIFADCNGKVRHLFDRECSVQRRHQKIIEEAPSPSLSNELRIKMGQAAVDIVSKAGYRGAGTVEFLLQDGEFYFLEVNTRLQVEHPVTELVLGIDLVKAQILTAKNCKVDFMDQELIPRGSSIECRLYAENPFQGGIPSTGKLLGLSFPESYGRRFECGLEEGDIITPYYDPMIAKLIVWDENRTKAIAKMKNVLADSVIFGVHTNIPLLEKIISHPDFQYGTMTTRFFEINFSDPLPIVPLTELQNEIIKHLVKTSKHAQKPLEVTSDQATNNPWLHYWRLV